MRLRSFFFGIKPRGGGFSRKPKDQTDNLLLTPDSRTRAIVKGVLKQNPLFSTKRQTRMNLLNCFRNYVLYVSTSLDSEIDLKINDYGEKARIGKNSKKQRQSKANLTGTG
jgi:hypothetical protein